MGTKIKIEAVIELDAELWAMEDKSEIEFFKGVMADKENTFLMLWSNDIGDEIGSTKEFKYEVIITTPSLLTPKK